jgi:hypothetical protein
VCHLESDCTGRAMVQQDAGFDFHRYRKLLAEANDEPKRSAINVLIDERAKDGLAALRGDRASIGSTKRPFAFCLEAIRLLVELGLREKK